MVGPHNPIPAVDGRRRPGVNLRLPPPRGRAAPTVARWRAAATTLSSGPAGLPTLEKRSSGGSPWRNQAVTAGMSARRAAAARSTPASAPVRWAAARSHVSRVIPRCTMTVWCSADCSTAMTAAISRSIAPSKPCCVVEAIAVTAAPAWSASRSTSAAIAASGEFAPDAVSWWHDRTYIRSWPKASACQYLWRTFMHPGWRAVGADRRAGRAAPTIRRVRTNPWHPCQVERSGQASSPTPSVRYWISSEIGLTMST